MTIQASISYGEFLDKLTILEIKKERIQDKDKLQNIQNELDSVIATWQNCPASRADIKTELAALKAINEKLWVIEDDIRDKERQQCFDQGFIDLARSVYFENDTRAKIKKDINLKLGSDLIEEKSYADYKTT
ncbi:hypothetical protein MNBD_GAMMA23-1943 [hydrothermal vent metagenome]|uniref:Uncharacterized protein n=1 Tax=hydrothermal vent metagenome TaxID=652676 RepID=A0A3B1AF53_9ZZZZ